MPARANEWHFHVLNPLAGTSKCAIHSYPSSLRYACLLPVSLFWTSSSGIPQKQSTAGARYAANNINHILEEASQATQTAVNIAGRNATSRSNIYQLGTEAALETSPAHNYSNREGSGTSLLREFIPLSRIPVFPDSNLLLAPAIDTVNRLPILLYQNQFADTRILVTISDQHIRGHLMYPLKGVRYVLRVADDIIGPTGDVMTLNGHYPYTEKVHSTKYHFTIIFNPPPLFSFYRLIDKGFGILIFILLIARAAALLLDRYFQ